LSLLNLKLPLLIPQREPLPLPLLQLGQRVDMVPMMVTATKEGESFE
jgi:hypothetical protein